MPETTTLKLTVYQPAVMADPGGQVGFEYDLAIVTPDLKIAARGDPARAASAACEVVPVTGALSFPNPAAPVVSPFSGLMFIYEDDRLIAFPLAIIAQSNGAFLTFNMNLSFPASPLYAFSGAIMFGDWPGPLSNVTASFLCPQPT